MQELRDRGRQGLALPFAEGRRPGAPLPHSISSPSLIVQVMYQKYALGLPLARQEKDWYRLGLILPRNDMADWVIQCGQRRYPGHLLLL